MDRYLQTRGYIPDARTLVLTATTDTIRQRTHAGSWIAEINGRPTDEWFDVYWSVEAPRWQGAHEAEVYRSILLNPASPSYYVTVSDGDETCAVGQLVLEDGWGGVQCLATAPNRRRQGAAVATLHYLAEQSAAGGAQGMYLAVMADNLGAQRLYERVGFITSHEYCYYERV